MGVWSLQQKLEADTRATRDAFGENALSLSGNTVLIGCPRTFQQALAPLPEAYVFVRSAGVWTKQAILSSGAANSFGNSVAIEGNVALVSAANGNGGSGPDSGLVYRFSRSVTAWSPPAILLPLDPAQGQGFGSALSINPTRFLIAAVGDNALTGAA